MKTEMTETVSPILIPRYSHYVPTISHLLPVVLVLAPDHICAINPLEGDL